MFPSPSLSPSPLSLSLSQSLLPLTCSRFGYLLCRFLQLVLKFCVDVNKQDSEGRTALHHASDMGSLAAVKMLLAAGAKSTVRCALGYTACDLASYRALHNGSTAHAFCRDELTRDMSMPTVQRPSSEKLQATEISILPFYDMEPDSSLTDRFLEMHEASYAQVYAQLR
jgi:hypothetical protein